MNRLLPERLGTRRALITILSVGLVLHLLSALGVFMMRPEAISTTPDPLDYRLAALNLLDHGTFSFAAPEFEAPQLLRPPVYPVLLAGTYLLDGRTGLLMILLQSVLLVAMGWLLFRVLGTFRVPDNIALFFTAFFLLEPLQWLYTLHTMTETLSSFIVLALVSAAFLGKGISDWKRASLFGVALGLLVLSKPSATMWVPFLLALIPLAAGSWNARAGRIAVAALFFFLTLLPWMIRNHNLTGHWIVSSSSVFNFILFAGTPETVPSEYWDVVTMASYNGHENQVWHAYTTNAYDMLLETREKILATVDYGSLIVRQLAYVPNVWFGFTNPQNQESTGHGYGLIVDFVLDPDPARDKVILIVDLALWSVLLGLTIVGTYKLLTDPRDRWRYLPLLAILLSTIFINFGAAWVRVLLPIYPAIFIAAGVGATYILHRTQPQV